MNIIKRIILIFFAFIFSSCKINKRFELELTNNKTEIQNTKTGSIFNLNRNTVWEAMSYSGIIYDFIFENIKKTDRIYVSSIKIKIDNIIIVKDVYCDYLIHFDENRQIYWAYINLSEYLKNEDIKKTLFEKYNIKYITVENIIKKSELISIETEINYTIGDMNYSEKVISEYKTNKLKKSFAWFDDAMSI